jgi:cytochrome c biogenesis protein CcmG, thiol:disulfide interchange protein DsbE
MKNFSLLIVILGFMGLTAFKPAKQFPTAKLKSLEGKTINISDEFAKNNLTVISFWATWCSPCKKELDAMKFLAEEWKKQGIEVIAVTIDDAQQLAKVKPMVNQKNWSYKILSDQNKDMQRLLNFQTIPQTFVVDKKGNILYSHNGYTPGDEHELDKKLKNFLKS